MPTNDYKPKPNHTNHISQHLLNYTVNLIVAHHHTTCQVVVAHFSNKANILRKNTKKSIFAYKYPTYTDNLCTHLFTFRTHRKPIENFCERRSRVTTTPCPFFHNREGHTLRRSDRATVRPD